MFELNNVHAPLTMSSREIADLLEKQHSHLKISAERLAERGVIGTLATREFTHNGNVYTEYLLNKRDSLILVAQNSPEFTARIVDRWQELEAMVSQPAIPQSLPEALRLAADLAEKKAKAEAALAVAAPKAEALDRMAGADGSLCITDAAKVLKVRPKDLFQWLHANHWTFRRPGSGVWVGYSDKVQLGLVEMIYTTVRGSDDQERTVERAKITPRGMTKLAQVLDVQAFKRAA